MNKLRIIALLLALVCVTSVLFSCNGEGSDNTAEQTTTADPSNTTKEPDGTTKEPDGTTTGGDDVPDPDPFPSGTYEIITIEKALELCGEPGNLTTERYYICATVDSVDNAMYGAMTISDATGSIYVYGTYSEDGSIGYADMADKPYAGDLVLLHCTLQNYNGTKEVKNARLIEFRHVEVKVDETDYTEMSIADARNTEKGKLVKVDGVVARITYAFGMKPSGFYLVDETQSIYVYDSELAARVNIGNKITILGSKTYWILDTETNNAQKFGYKGCCQLENAVLVSNDAKTDNEFNKSWITESTVKDILDNPVSNDITTSIFKVNALVKKVVGTGFTNYYFFDLDGKTGSYTYTQCSGSDFTWLDKFDGKICTVYLSAINAKSTSSDCVYRLFPVLVEDNNFKFDTANAAEHVVKYYGMPQFLLSYSGDPALELVTSVSSDLLGFTDAKLSYASSDASVIKFTENGGKTVMNCLATGKATVTVTGSFGGKTFSNQLEITVTANTNYDFVSVKDAIASANDTVVTVKGIVGPSLVNQSGFYLIDETGVIAVLVDASVFEGISVGNEIVLKGTRSVKTKGGTNYYGQTYLAGGEILANYYGSHEYSTATFIEGKTLADFYGLNVLEDYSTSVFILKATVSVVETSYYTTIELKNGTTKVSLYCSGAGQYSWLKQFAGQEVTMELAACNWNDKTYYRGCVLAVYTENGKVVNELNFTTK